MSGDPQPAPVPDRVLRQRRLVDQAMSMHAALRDRAAQTSTTITVVLLCASAAGTAFAFAGDNQAVQLLGLQASRSTWLGVLSVVVFCGTLVELVTDRRGAARRHDAAVRLLSDLMSAHREAPVDGDWAEVQARLTERYDQVTDRIPPIPESRFNKLKSQHLRKVEISKLLSEHPGITVKQAQRLLKQRLDS